MSTRTDVGTVHLKTDLKKKMFILTALLFTFPGVRNYKRSSQEQQKKVSDILNGPATTKIDHATPTKSENTHVEKSEMSNNVKSGVVYNNCIFNIHK